MHELQMVGRVNLAKKWLLNSGIQKISKNKKINGGFNSWYDLKSKTYPFIYSEITGYGITTLLNMSQEMKKNLLIKRAKIAADWLIKNAQHESGGFKVRYIKNKRGKYTFENLLYAFDTGIIAFALANLFKITNDEAYLESAERAASFLMKSQKEDGLFYAFYNLKTKQFLDITDKWSTQSGSFHAKVAMGLINLWKITGNESYRKSAKIACHAALKFQDIGGRFITYRDSKETHLHPHFYSAEGLLYAGLKLNEKAFIESAVKACKWALDNQLDSGGIPFLYTGDKFIEYERTDILAQALRLGTVLYSLGKLEEAYMPALKRLKERLCTFQLLNKADKGQTGGFLFGFDFDGKRIDHVNSWCTMFAYQALDMYYKVVEMGKKVSLDLFI
jgi:hypothetical protein